MKKLIRDNFNLPEKVKDYDEELECIIAADVDLELMDYKQMETEAKNQIRQAKVMLLIARKMLAIARAYIQTLEDELKNPKVATEEDKKNNKSKIDYAG